VAATIKGRPIREDISERRGLAMSSSTEGIERKRAFDGSVANFRFVRIVRMNAALFQHTERSAANFKCGASSAGAARVAVCVKPAVRTIDARADDGYAESGILHEFMATIDEDLNQLERDVRQLKIEYEQFFGGGRARPPAEIEWRIELVIKRYGERGANMRFAQRYRYGNIAQTYARYREVFRKRLKKKEEGTVERHFGAAARKIQAERDANQAALNAATERSSSLEAGATHRVSVSYSGADRDSAKTIRLYEAFREAKLNAGENVSKLTLEAFQNFLERKTDELRQKNAHANVEFIVSVEGGRVKLKARTTSSSNSKTK
jgi:hypothetical protein